MAAPWRQLGLGLYQVARTIGVPGHWPALWRDLGAGRAVALPDELHLQAALDWLCRAQDASTAGGVSAGYFMGRGWAPPYPETTGYIIPTLIRGGAALGRPELLGRALELGDWEIELQLGSGAVRGGRARLDRPAYPVVFNTGQVVFGWLALFRALGEERFLAAAARAADWLVTTQDADGKWSRHVYGGMPTVYHTRVAWALFETAADTGEERYGAAARAHIDWALAQSDEHGWSPAMALEAGAMPLTHTIAYSLRGWFESVPYLDARAAAAADRLVRRVAAAMAAAIVPVGGRPATLPAHFGPGWTPIAGSACLTGEAQMVGLWTRLYRRTGDPRFRRAARRLLLGLKAAQSLASGHPGIHGALAGSRPVWGRYLRFAYPNWATKFLADALLEQHPGQLAGLPALPG